MLRALLYMESGTVLTKNDIYIYYIVKMHRYKDV